MVAKVSIIEELGEEELILPSLVNSALVANERIKYYFALLQTSVQRAREPSKQFPDLRAERVSSGEGDVRLDKVVQNTTVIDTNNYSIPLSEQIFASILSSMDEMIRPLLVSGEKDGRGYQARLEELKRSAPPPQGDTVPGELLWTITSGDRSKGDSFHILVMDLHKALNGLQKEMSEEVVDGARTYLLQDGDAELVGAFMSGINRTLPLKFDHPGLGTTATRIGDKLVIQNDIGETDAHVLVIGIKGKTVSITHTDVHMSRVLFFKGLFDPFDVKWEDTLSRNARDVFEGKLYHLVMGNFSAKDRSDLEKFLELIGSRIVFLIDWNRARKRLQNFMPKSDCMSVLKWAVENEVGHRAFLILGGDQLIFEALDLAPKLSLRYGEPLHNVLGRTRTMDYFQWVLKRSTQGLLARQSDLLIQDEIKAELLRYFRSAPQELMDICSEHASIMVEVASAVRDSLRNAQHGGSMDFIDRSSKRAKRLEREADDMVDRVRTLSKRIEVARFFAGLISHADDAIDYLEEAAFLTTFLDPVQKSEGVYSELYLMADIATRGSQEYLRALYAAQYVHRGSTQEEMRDFLGPMDRVVGLEEDCDEALRKTQSIILQKSAQFKDAIVFFEIARNIEESTNSLMKAAFTMRDNIFESIGGGG